MDEEIRKFFEDVCEKVRNSPGSVDTIFTSGTSILSENVDQWIGFGVSNVSEIYSHLEEIGRGIDLNRQDLLAGMLEDVLPALEDLAYHSAVFGIYFFSVEDILQQNISKAGISRLSSSRNDRLANPTMGSERIDNQFFESMISEARQAKVAFENVFSSSVSDYPRQLLNLYELRRSLLSLEIRTCLLKELRWR